MVDCHFSRRMPPLLPGHQDNIISTSIQSPARKSLQNIDERHIYSIQCKKKGHLETEEYEQAWEENYLNQAAREWYDNERSHQTLVQRGRQEHMSKDRESKFKIFGKKFSKRKQRQFEKYRAYAVKLKIPAFSEIQRGRSRNEKKNQGHSHKNTDSKNHLSQIYDYLHPKLEELVKNHSKNLSNNPYDEHKNAILFNKRTLKGQNEKKLTLRKKSIHSINNVEKKKNFEPNFVRSTNEYFKTSLSPRGLKKLKVSHEGERNSYFQKRYQQEGEQIESKNKSQIGCRSCKKEEMLVQRPEWHQNTRLSPVKQTGKISPIKHFAENTSKYLEKGISFKRNKKKEDRQKEKPVSSLAQRQGEFLKQREEYSQKNITEHSESPQKLITRMIYTSKDMIRQKNRANSGKCDLQQSKEFKINKVLIFNSEDTYIRRLLMSSSWIVNPDNRSKYYHLKWVFKPNSEDYNNIRQGQFINHIKNSHELTSKNYLNKNLKKSLSLWPNLNLHYPKCYDIAKGSERQQFFEQFVKEFMMNLLQKLYSYLQECRRQDVHRYTGLYHKLIDQKGDYKTEEKEPSLLRRSQFRKIDLQDYRSYDSTCLVHMNLIIVALRYWRHLRKKLEMTDDSCFHFLNYTQRQLEEHLSYLEKYSKGVIPSFSAIDQPYFVKQFYATPSQITIERIVKQYVYFQRLLGKQWRVYGSQNTWIIKPCSASRGNGIYLQNNCKEILFNSNGGIQSKIVQRYIQRPLIFKSLNYKQIVNKKFDIRQWVLLRSVAPLQIYMFSHCYVRICSEQYNIGNIKNLRAHLTNYSFNKHFYKDRSESVLDHESFTNLLKSECNVDYQSLLKPKITQIIIKSIKSSQELLEDYSQRCFSLLGYDILLDEQCNPWLLEVNMSPACEERTQWLKQYLNEMGKGLLKIILPENYFEAQQEIKPQSSLEPHEQKLITQITERSLGDMYQDTEQNKVKKNVEGSQNAYSEDNQSVHEQIQITYEDFINQHNVQTISPEKNTEEDELRVKVPTQCMESGYATALLKNLQISIVQDEEQLLGKYDFVKEKEESQLERVNKENGNCSPFNDANDPIQDKAKSLKWELICLEQYSQPKKDKDLCLQIAGVKITADKMLESDRKINEWARYQSHIQSSILKVQKSIRTFLINRRLTNQIKKEESHQSLKVNFSRLIKKRVQRQSKSVYCATQQRSKSIWHYSYRHIYEGDACRSVMIERPQTSRTINHQNGASKMKRSSEIKIGDTIKQLFAKGRLLIDEDLNIKKKISNIAVKHFRNLQTQMKQDNQPEIHEEINKDERDEVGRMSERFAHVKTEGQ